MHRACSMVGAVAWYWAASMALALSPPGEAQPPPAAGRAAAATLALPSPATAAGEPAPTEAAGHGWLRPGWWLQPVRRRMQWLAQREIVQLVAALARGDGLEPGKGWFQGSQTRLDWKWLAAKCDADQNGAISPEELAGPDGFFERLDRNRDGTIRAEDFDWSDSSPYVRELAQARLVFRRADASSNGRVSRQEWQELFERAAAGKEYITPDDLRAVLFPPQPASADEGPSPLVLFKGFLTGELGSVLEGPGVGDYAPQFELYTYDGTESYSLARFLGRPVVLIFGSFT